MPWVNELLKKLFSDQKQETISWKEKYSFSGEIENYEKEDFHAFAGFMVSPEMWFINQYEVVSLHTPQSQGIVLKSTEKEDFEFFENFIEFFKQSLCASKLYYNPVKEKRHEETETEKKETIFVYLKPSSRIECQGKHDQKYGQVSMSLINFNDVDYSLKIQVNYYSGFEYTVPKHLKELMTFISLK